MATVAHSTRSTIIILASDGAGPFDLDFRLFDTDAIQVFVNYEKVDPGDYTLSATFADGFDDNATVTFDAAQSNGDRIEIISDLTPGRADDYNDGPLLTKLLNVELARIWSKLQDHDRDISRSLRTFGTSDPGNIGVGAVPEKTADGWREGPTTDDLTNASANASAAAVSAAEAAASAAAAATYDPAVHMRKDQNLSDVASASTSRTNLGLGTAAVQADSYFLQKTADKINSATAKLLVNDTKYMTVARTVDAMRAFAVDQVQEITASDDAFIQTSNFDPLLHDGYLIDFWNVVPATDGAELRIRTSADSGATVDTNASDYGYGIVGARDGPGVGQEAANNAAFIKLTGSVGSNTGEDGVSGQLFIPAPHLAKVTSIGISTVCQNDSNNIRTFDGGGIRRAQEAIHAVRFYFSTGNIFTGTFQVRGVPKWL